MPELHDLSPTQGSHRNRKRLGRGPGSGTGKTAGRGHKGQKARTGGKVARGFEGGQMPLQRRIPKRGFKNIHRIEFQVVNIRDLAKVEGSEVTPEVLKASGLIGNLRLPVKILGMGEVAKALQVTAHAFSGTAMEKIRGAGGSVTVLELNGEVAEVSGSEESPAPETAAEAEDEKA